MIKKIKIVKVCCTKLWKFLLNKNKIKDEITSPNTYTNKPPFKWKSQI